MSLALYSPVGVPLGFVKVRKVLYLFDYEHPIVMVHATHIGKKMKKQRKKGKRQ